MDPYTLLDRTTSSLDLDPATIALSVFFSFVGYAYYRYGRRQQKTSAVVAGIALCIFPYFVSSVFGLLGIGAALMAAPFFIVF